METYIGTLRINQLNFSELFDLYFTPKYRDNNAHDADVPSGKFLEQIAYWFVKKGGHKEFEYLSKLDLEVYNRTNLPKFAIDAYKEDVQFAIDKLVEISERLKARKAHFNKLMTKQ